ncbi:electron transfer flavoprotein subunit beta/FixA family protein [candidate division KSB1 bacterium]|nr:electron transfer flavoprotein subunit beta/FixA family protein [candidate division KSB1 bacterium]
MKVVVCVREVPDTETYIKIDASQKNIVDANVTFVMNPYDEYAVEEALKLQESAGAETVAVCPGSARADDVLRSAVAMGVQSVIRVNVAEPIWDGLTTAKLLAGTLKEMDFDLLILGKEAIDDGTQQLGPMLGELLDLPCISLVTKLDVADGSVTAERESGEGVEVIEASTPCIITAQKGLNEPRYPSLRGKMAAKKAIIEVKEASVGNVQLEVTGMEYPPARGKATVVGEGVEAVPELVRLLREEAKAI